MPDPSAPVDPASPPPVEPAPLPLEPAPIPEPVKPPEPAHKKEPPPPAHAKFDLTLYGFVELDSIYDSTQGLNDGAGNASIARPHSYAANHGQLTFGGRNSRLGVKLAAPIQDGMKATAQLEMDFLGNQPPGISEAAFWQNPTMRFRHAFLKLESDVVDVLVGQTWHLFGWQGAFFPNTVAIQGVPGQVYSRFPQARIGKVIKMDAVEVEIAAAASRSQRASATPDGTVALKVLLPKLKAWHTSGSTGSALDSAAIGVSGIGRRFTASEFSANPQSQVTAKGYGVSVDALIPLFPATKESKANATTITGSFVYGKGIADLYTGLSGGVGNPALPIPMGAPAGTAAPVYTPNLDNGLALFLADGSLHPIQWTSYMAGIQYYLPPSGRVWLAFNGSRMTSDNAKDFGAKNKVWDRQTWLNGNIFADITSAVRLGVSLDVTRQTYVDGVDATNYRVQGSGFFIF